MFGEQDHDWRRDSHVGNLLLLYDLEKLLKVESRHDVVWYRELGCNYDRMLLAERVIKWQKGGGAFRQWLMPATRALGKLQANGLFAICNEVGVRYHDAFGEASGAYNEISV